MMVLRLEISWRLLLSCIIVLLLPCTASRLAPGDDPDGPPPPFGYFAFPTEALGVPDGGGATELTPDGGLCTGTHDAFFLLGRGLSPSPVVSPTALAGWMPIYQWRCRRDGLVFRLRALATALPQVGMVNLVQVSIHNPGPNRAVAAVGLGFRFRKNDPHWMRPRIAFQRYWAYQFSEDRVLRDRRLLGVLPPSPTERLSTLDWSYGGLFPGSALNVRPDTPVLLSRWNIPLAPRATASRVFAIPRRPAAPAMAAAIRHLRFEATLRREATSWESRLAGAASLQVPEGRVNELYRAALAQILLAREPLPPGRVPAMPGRQEGLQDVPGRPQGGSAAGPAPGREAIAHVNGFQYNGFWLRDAAYITRALDVAGLCTEAAECARYTLRWQRPDGLFLSQRGQPDGWGEALWTLGAHARLWRDRRFAQAVYPAVQRAVSWLEQARRSDATGLLPPADPHDNEGIRDHLFGTDFWAYRGLAESVRMARALGRKADAASWSAERSRYRAAILAALARATQRSGGAIPPALEPGGLDWGNLTAAWPSEILGADQPWFLATERRARARGREGLLTYGGPNTLHGYLGFPLAMADLRRGDGASALRALYAALAHTTAAGGGFETADLRTRDFGRNLSPHGTFAAGVILLLRDMLVREDGDTLHLGSALSPAWVRPGDEVRVNNAPTDFGPVSWTLRATPGGAQVTLRLPPNLPSASATSRSSDALLPAPPLRRVVLHAPVGYRILEASVDGKPVPVPNGTRLALPPAGRAVLLRWRRLPGPGLSLASTIRALKRR